MSEGYSTDEEQIEAVKHWFAENGSWLLGGALLGAALLFGLRYFENHRYARELAAAAQFDQMTAALDRRDAGSARRIAEQITEKYSGSAYADQAELTLARLFVSDGSLADAVAPLRRVMNQSSDAELQKIARLRLARLLIADGRPDEALKTLAAVPDPGTFAALFDEVRGDALYAEKDRAGAVAAYRRALAANGPNGGDGALLSLKIADLGAAPAANGATPAASAQAAAP
ncbi:MAG TPA: tetratricopeptide repeat protein [Steroidobacteraceae bacterium]|nr:tetratricopeptide repeat protein [Steroidobacteraceae bacterium]